MLRVLVVLLLAANALFFAWSRGWLEPWMPARADAREPERLKAQLRPETITVLSAGAAASAVAAASAATAGAAALRDGEPPPLCLEAGPYTSAAAGAAENALSQAGVPVGLVQREQVWTQSSWGVVMGRFADREALRLKAEELQRLGVRYDELQAPPQLMPGLRLGNYSDRYGAEAALEKLAQKGVRTARVAELPVGAGQHWLRAAKADTELQTRLKTLPPGSPEFKPCAAAPR